MTNHRLKRPLLYTLIGSVILAAVLGIVIVLRGKWGWFEVRVILTTAILAGASLCGLACDLSRTPQGRNWLPRLGMLLTFASTVLLLLGMWSEIDSEGFWKTSAVTAVFTVAVVHVCLLSIARLARKFSWVFLVAMQVIFGLAALIAVMIVAEIDDEMMFRLLAALAIVAAAISMVIPLLHRISRAELAGVVHALDSRNLAEIDDEMKRLSRRIEELQRLKQQIINREPKDGNDLSY